MRELIDVALGKKKAELVIKNVDLVNVYTEEVYSTDIAIHKGTIAGIGRYNGKKQVNAKNLYATPGLIDAHIHIESSLLTPSQFARAVIPHGTTAVISDPHEIANVLGVKGIDYMIKDAAKTPLKYYFGVSSCVPSTNMETSGAKIGLTQTKKLLCYPNCVGLAEMMNYPGVLSKNSEILAKIEMAKLVDGHAPLLSGKALNAYISQNITSDHECTNQKEALEKMKLGMKIMIRQGSTAKNMEALLPLAKKHPENCMLVTDDKHADDLLKGHLDILLKQAVKDGIDPIKALKMVTLNPANYFSLNNGVIAPGKPADIVLFDSLRKFNVKKVFINGKQVANNNKPLFKTSKSTKTGNTINCKQINQKDLELKPKGKVKAIGLIKNQIITKTVITPVKGDVLPIAVIERYGKGNIGKGYVKGFTLKRGALASTVAHDSHNIIVIGKDYQSMITAVNTLRKTSGGWIVTDKKKVLALLDLPIAGIMSDKTTEQVAKELPKLNKAAKQIGCRLNNPFMTLSFLALPVIPEIKLTDKGLVDVKKFKIIKPCD
ncbi:adenine deaminase [archaeon]|nr:adenine deaminase [archaeon]